MKVESVSLKVPSRVITNDHILDLLRDHSNGVSKTVLTAYQRLTKMLLHRAGSETRYVRDIEHKERARDLVVGAIDEALALAELKPAAIDLLIYCGVGKGFIEPANAYFYAHETGMEASCFDVTDACMSWIRALEIAYEFLKTLRYRKVMIINGEFNFQEHGFPANFVVRSLKQLEYTFPTYTIGEAATATIVSASENDWRFAYKSVPELCDLCTIPLEGHADFVSTTDRINKNGTLNFVSYGAELFTSAERYLAPLLRENVVDLDAPDVYFPHAASSNAYLRAGRRNGVRPDKIYAKVFPQYGNLVSASIPAGMYMALAEGQLKRGDSVVFCPASAGMVYGVVQFTY